ncbi:hypothetical protein NN561_016665 [Cricetulus griseus]
MHATAPPAGPAAQPEEGGADGLARPADVTREGRGLLIVRGGLGRLLQSWQRTVREPCPASFFTKPGALGNHLVSAFIRLLSPKCELSE